MIKIGRCTSQGLDCYTSPIPGGETTTEHILEDGLVAAAATAFKIAVRRMKKRTRTKCILDFIFRRQPPTPPPSAAAPPLPLEEGGEERKNREAMGKAAKGSRKGKKAWRANISTDNISTRTRFVGSFGTATEIPAKRKIEKHKDQILHYESLLQKNPFVQPVPSSTSKKLKRKKKKVDIEKAQTQNASKVCFQI
ncbi:hypothetical protein B296_00015042 [Ensete ventricosum]|uniref:Ribosome biogenesis protein NOP53 n=1 Tax=Ensete ventricosum TaxID=4639 RepID=A0A427ATZ7_ENSVE|nr:hypothetical protein B296_00015042 [Ensete ventricosum]